MTDAHTWEDLELPVLRWVHERTWAQPGELKHLDEGHRSTELPLTDAELDEALRRLSEYGLTTGQRDEALVVWWSNVRPTADGLRVLAEWPPVEAAAINVTLARVLRSLAGELGAEDATAAKRAGSALSKMSGEVVLDVVTDRLKSLGEDVVT
jgi:hypothetical protein